MPNTDTARLFGGFSALPGGVDYGTDASLIGNDQAFFAANISFRDDLPVTRQPWLSCPLDTELTGRFQGACFYNPVISTDGQIILAVEGRLYRVGLSPSPGPTCTVTEITPQAPDGPILNPAAVDVFLFQAEKYVIALARNQPTLVYDGVKTTSAGPKQVPSGVLGLYAWGRLWITRNDLRTFVAGDIVYGPSGSASEGFVDALLFFTENTFLNENGVFGVPNNAGPITCMAALATIDTSLGIGPVLVGTTNSVVSVNAPPDRTVWANLTYPIQTISLLNYGPVGPHFIANVNNDLWYRSSDGIRSFMIARRDTTAPGNTPMSHEIGPILANDTQALLFDGSAILFDNRLLSTIAPRATELGTLHDGLVAMNFDSLSTLRGKQPPIWEGVHSGLAMHRLLVGRVNGVERGFAIARHPQTDALELWELLPEGAAYYDTYRALSEEGGVTIVRTPIPTQLETKRYDYDRLVQLQMAELYLDEIVDDISLRILFRPDQYPSWTQWTTITLCATVTQCTIATPEQFSCTIWKPNARTYAARIRLPKPPEDCNVLAGLPLDRAYQFQFRFEGTGHFRLRKFRPHVRILTDATYGECPPTSAVCAVFRDCGTPWLDYEIARAAP